jgi:hypothetical protein
MIRTHHMLINLADVYIEVARYIAHRRFVQAQDEFEICQGIDRFL